jgi:hypothetical protein
MIFLQNSSALIGDGAATGAAIAVDPPGRCAYVTETLGITRYSVNQKSGAVSAVGDTAVGEGGAFGPRCNQSLAR